MLSVEPIFERAFRMSGAVPGRLLVLAAAAPMREVVVFFSAVAAVEEEEGVAGLAAVEEEEGVAGLAAAVRVRDAEGVETEDLAAAVVELLVLGLAESAKRRGRSQERHLMLFYVTCCKTKITEICNLMLLFQIHAALTEHISASSFSVSRSCGDRLHPAGISRTSASASAKR